MSLGIERWSRQDVFRRAWELANSLVPVPVVAQQIALEAMNLAHIKWNEQSAHRRRWQNLKKYLVGPKRFLKHENQLVQSMVLYVAPKYERWHEGERHKSLAAEIHAGLNNYSKTYEELTELVANQPLSQKDLMVRYLAALVHSANQSSRDLVTAILCLVCNYQAQEAADFHARFIKIVAANYFSKRKSKIMEELHNRFAKFISVRKLPGRATFFAGQEVVNPRHASVVATFLQQIVPWGTTCPSGQGTRFSSQLADFIQQLAGKKTLRFITASDCQELIYAHILTCEDCFLKMLQEMNLGCAREHLTLPDFFWEAAINMGSNVSTENNPLPIEPEEKEAFMQVGQLYMEHEAQRRKKVKLENIWLASGEGKLPLDVAGNQVYQWAVNQSGQLPLLKVNKRITAIRLVAQDAEGELVVGIWMPHWDRLTDSWFYRWWGRQQDSVWLATGERIKFTILRRFSSVDQEELGIKLCCVPPRINWLPAWDTSWWASWWANWGLNWQYAALAVMMIALGGLGYQRLSNWGQNIKPELSDRGGDSTRTQGKQAVGNASQRSNIVNDVAVYAVTWDLDITPKTEQVEVWKLPKDKKIVVIKLRSTKRPVAPSYQWEILDKDQNSIALEKPQNWTQEKGQYVATLMVANTLGLGKNYRILLWAGKKTPETSTPVVNRLIRLERSN